MAFSETDLATLDKAIASGALSVRYSDGRAVTYRSIAELIEARRLVQGVVDAAAGTVRTRQVRIYTRDGF